MADPNRVVAQTSIVWFAEAGSMANEKSFWAQVSSVGQALTTKLNGSVTEKTGGTAGAGVVVGVGVANVPLSVPEGMMVAVAVGAGVDADVMIGETRKVIWPA